MEAMGRVSVVGIVGMSTSRVAVGRSSIVDWMRIHTVRYVLGMQFQEGSFGCIPPEQTRVRNQLLQY